MSCIVDTLLNPARLLLILVFLGLSLGLHFTCYFPLARKMVVSERYRMWDVRRLASAMAMGSCPWVVLIAWACFR